jgi:hypothetical protein
MAKSPYRKPLSARQKNEQQAAWFQAAAVLLFRAAVEDMATRVPVVGGVERYDRAAKLRLAHRLDAFRALLQRHGVKA